MPATQSRLLLACGCALPVPALALGVALGEPLGGALGALLASSAAAGLLSTWRTTTAPEWTRARVERTVGLMLRRLLVLTASMALVTSPLGRAGLPTTLLILAGYPLASRLRRIAPPS